VKLIIKARGDVRFGGGTSWLAATAHARSAADTKTSLKRLFKA